MPDPGAYREHPPHPALSDHVSCYWTIRRDGGSPARDLVVPDGCLDLLFDVVTGRASFVGTMTRPLGVVHGGGADLMGVRFRPGAIPYFVDLPADEVTDGIVDATEVWGADAGGLPERLAARAPNAARVEVLDHFLTAWLARRPGRGDPVAHRAAALVTRSHGRIRVTGLAEAVGIGRRQLERRFRAAVGVPPSTAGRVLRFQAALHHLLESPGRPLTWVALEAGYHDQPHMTREFRTFAGETPAAYRARRWGARDASVQDGSTGAR